VTLSLWGLVAAALAAVLHLVPALGPYALGQAHVLLSLFAFLLPALAAGTAHSLHAVLARSVDAARGRRLAILWAAGSLVLALVAAFATGGGLVPRIGLGLGALLLTAAAGMTTGALLRALPRRGESVVDVARDRLTKGDDACATQLRFAQFFLPLGVLMATFAGPWWSWSSPWAARVYLAGIHLLAGHILVSCYGLAHLWIPRLSGVPAIAAGAIKGELHTTLLGLVLMVAGFLSGGASGDPGAASQIGRRLIIAGGAFAFLGAFVFMGVLGANIMKNKSKTQRITPEFTYIPWAFTAVFWLLSGVLLGIFLNVVPDLYASSRGALRFTHVHIALLGGAAQLLLALAWRVVPAARGVPPPPFSRGKWGYWGLNLGLALLLWGRFQEDSDLVQAVVPITFSLGALLVLLGLAASFMTLQRHGRVARMQG
jgi:hypothetical protein